MNFNHLYYFWTVAREGSIAKATKKLNLTQPTISTQIRQLEQSLGEKLFEKAGRGLKLTAAGRVALRYADEIFALGRELADTLRDRPTGRPPQLTVGIADVVPKMIAYRVLRPAFGHGEKVEMICREGSSDALFEKLALHELDLVISDVPVSRAAVRAFNHFLGESGVTLFGSPALASAHGRHFPKSLNGAPVLLPAQGTQLRRALEHWLDANGIVPHRAGDFEDTALMEAFGYGGVGIFPAPTAIEKEIQKQYNVRVVGRLPEVRERFYAISPERRIKNRVVGAITDAARRELFEGGARA